MAQYNWSNLAVIGNLTALLTDAATSLTVDDATGFPSGDFKIWIDNEIILVGTRTGTTFSSLTRGHDSTTAAEHQNGAAVRHAVTAEDLLTRFLGFPIPEPLVGQDGYLPQYDHTNTEFDWVDPTVLGPMFNVKNYGATGDGSTDDSAAIQAAINAANGERAVVYFPPCDAHYQCDNDLDAKRCHLKGSYWPGNSGFGGTVIEFSGTYGISSSISDNHGYSISHMMIRGSNGGTPTATGQILVDFTGQNQPHLEYVLLSQSDRGMLLEGDASIECHYGTFFHVNVYQCYVGVEFDSATYSANTHSFYGGRYWSCETGVLIDSDTLGINFFGTTFECGSGNLAVDSTGSAVVFSGAHWETAGTNLTVRSGAGEHIIIGGSHNAGTFIDDANDPSVVYGYTPSEAVRATHLPGNRIRNGSFEFDSGKSGEELDDWTLYYSDGSGYSITQDAIENQHGTYCAKITNTGMTQLGIYQEFDVIPNVPHIIRWKAKVPVGTTVQNRVGTYAGDTSLLNRTLTSDGTWTTYSQRFTPTTDTVFVTIMQTGSVVDTYYADEYTCEPGWTLPYGYTDNPITSEGGRIYGDLEIDGSLTTMGNATEVAGAVTLDETHGVVNMESTAATRAVTLPDNADFAGKSYLIRRDGTNNVTVTRAGSDTFDDATTSKTLTADGDYIEIFSIGDGEWKIVQPDISTPIATHAAIVDSHHAKYTDGEAVTAMGVKDDTNALNHDRYTDAEADARAALLDHDHATPIATHAAIVDSHHAKYTDSEAVTAMGVKGNTNALNHDRYTDGEADARVALQVHNQSHVLDGSDHTVSGLTTNHVLKASSATTFGFASPFPLIDTVTRVAVDSPEAGDLAFYKNDGTTQALLWDESDGQWEFSTDIDMGGQDILNAAKVEATNNLNLTAYNAGGARNVVLSASDTGGTLRNRQIIYGSGDINFFDDSTVTTLLWDESDSRWEFTATPYVGANPLHTHLPPIVFASGDVAIAVKTGTGRMKMPYACTLKSVTATVGVAPTGASVIVDVNKNGTTVFTTQANRPEIAISGNDSSKETPDVTAVASGDVLTVDIDQVGSTIAGQNLTVIIEIDAP